MARDVWFAGGFEETLKAKVTNISVFRAHLITHHIPMIDIQLSLIVLTLHRVAYMCEGWSLYALLAWVWVLYRAANCAVHLLLCLVLCICPDSIAWPFSRLSAMHTQANTFGCLGLTHIHLQSKPVQTCVSIVLAWCSTKWATKAAELSGLNPRHRQYWEIKFHAKRARLIILPNS